MRIVGKRNEQDYYDTCLGYGYDETVTYVRKRVDVEVATDHPVTIKVLTDRGLDGSNDGYYSDHNINWRNLPYRNEHEITRGKVTKRYDVDPGYVGFCGKIYPFYCITTGTQKTPSKYNPPKQTFHYSMEDLESQMRKLGMKFREPNKPSKYFRQLGSSWRDNTCFTKENVQKVFETTEDIDLFFEIGNPSFLLYTHQSNRQLWSYTENPLLKEVEFYKIIDSYTAFQEISMFLGGVLGGSHPPLIQISDKDMAIKKGFGHKYAFRKEPEKK